MIWSSCSINLSWCCLGSTLLFPTTKNWQLSSFVAVGIALGTVSSVLVMVVLFARTHCIHYNLEINLWSVASFSLAVYSTIPWLKKFDTEGIMHAALLSGISFGLSNPGPGCLAHKYSLSKFSTFGIFLISGKHSHITVQVSSHILFLKYSSLNFHFHHQGWCCVMLK